MSRVLLTLFTSFLSLTFSVMGQTKKGRKEEGKKTEQKHTPAVKARTAPGKVYYGIASYYAEKFKGRKTANGERYNPDKLTAACNVLPLGTWIRVTNMKNLKSVVVKINDRLHAKVNRVVDLSQIGAEKLGYVKKGLTRVKVEVLGKKKP